MLNRKNKITISSLLLMVILCGCGEEAGLKIENDSENEIVVTKVSINGKNVLSASKNLPSMKKGYSHEGHISKANLSGKEKLSIEVGVNGKSIVSTCQIPELIGEGSCYMVFAHFNGTETMKCNYVCDNLYEGN